MAGEPNGRVTTAQFHVVQLETQREIFETREQISDMELQIIERIASTETRIMKELKPLSELMPKVERNEEEIERLRNNSNLKDGLIAFATLVGTAIGWPR